MVRTAQVIPDNERWLHTPEALATLDRALKLSGRTERAESNLNALARRIKSVRKPA